MSKAASKAVEAAIATVDHFHECGVCQGPPLFSSSKHTSIPVRSAARAQEQWAVQAADNHHDLNFTCPWPIDEKLAASYS
jgi:hypothetical protein